VPAPAPAPATSQTQTTTQSNSQIPPIWLPYVPNNSTTNEKQVNSSPSFLNLTNPSNYKSNENLQNTEVSSTTSPSTTIPSSSSASSNSNLGSITVSSNKQNQNTGAEVNNLINDAGTVLDLAKGTNPVTDLTGAIIDQTAELTGADKNPIVKNSLTAIDGCSAGATVGSLAGSEVPLIGNALGAAAGCATGAVAELVIGSTK
jgi:hypothetical protein